MNEQYPRVFLLYFLKGLVWLRSQSLQLFTVMFNSKKTSFIYLIHPLKNVVIFSSKSFPADLLSLWNCSDSDSLAQKDGKTHSLASPCSEHIPQSLSTLPPEGFFGLQSAEFDSFPAWELSSLCINLIQEINLLVEQLLMLKMLLSRTGNQLPKTAVKKYLKKTQ